MSRWQVYGRWPSTHDLDVLLDADSATRRAVARWAATLGHDGYHFVPAADVPLDATLIQQAIDAAARCKPLPFLSYGPDALPIDAILLRRRNRPCLIALVPPPYTTWRLTWVSPIPDGFVAAARDLHVPVVAESPLLLRHRQGLQHHVLPGQDGAAADDFAAMVDGGP